MGREFTTWISQKRYILLKGLLHRADYAASAKRKSDLINDYVEQGMHEDVGRKTKDFIRDKGHNLRELQEFTEINQDKNILLVAQTGSGKTEAALIWIGKEKGFITLPLRVSLNAMYKRIKNETDINFESTSLLHSGAFDYLLMNEIDKETFETTTQQISYAQLLSSKLTLSTIDQIFKFPLLYKGFERELATLAYSKVVIDEIQAYDPHIVAILIRGLEMLTQLGGKWMIMTATLPAIFLDELEKRKLLEPTQTARKTILLPDDCDEDQDNKIIVPRRHWLKLLDTSVLECVEVINTYAVERKVLVVVNTVMRALAVYDALNGDENANVHLLHSQFIARDRSKKEKEIEKFGQLYSKGNKRNTKPGVWITTQIVEASMDIDFDYLFTEAATPDALFQRFGRCNRKGERPQFHEEGIIPNQPNVFICTEDVSGLGSVYEEKIVKDGLEALQVYDDQLMNEKAKLQIVNDVFSKEQLEGTEYLAIFEKSLKELENITPFSLDSKQAQKILRDISSCLLIPGQALYEEAMRLKEQYYATEKDDYSARRMIMQQLNQLTVSVNPHRLRYRSDEEGFTVSCFDDKAFSYIRYAAVRYSATRGLELACDDVSSRFF